jgi:hypothetical protein
MRKFKFINSIEYRSTKCMGNMLNTETVCHIQCILKILCRFYYGLYFCEHDIDKYFNSVHPDLL